MKVDLNDLLPAGEWANVQVLNQPAGMMAKKAWAVLAKAKRVRDGGKAAFIKFIVAAGSHAGDTTLMFTSPDRLGGLHERLRQLHQLEDTVPIVPLLDIQRTEKGLLIAMEEVRPLSDFIDKGEAYHLSAKVLEDLDPDTDGIGWHHFDVCPKNIGVLPSGRCVLIDLDSVYLEREGRYDISAPAWKPFRAPQGLVQDVFYELELGGVGRIVAARKLRFEIALAAAECVLGPILSTGQNLDRGTINAWIASADAADPAVVFWKQELLAAIDTGNFPTLQELREKLESALGAGTEPAGAPLVQVPTDSTESARPPAIAISAISADPAQAEWLEEWALVLPMVHALRAGKLDGKQIVEYRQALRQVAARYPAQADVWNELLLVVISYEKDAELALSVVNEALDKIPGNDGLARMRNIIQMWVRGRQHGSN